jgi:hypothetical protein
VRKEMVISNKQGEAHITTSCHDSHENIDTLRVGREERNLVHLPAEDARMDLVKWYVPFVLSALMGCKGRVRRQAHSKPVRVLEGGKAADKLDRHYYECRGATELAQARNTDVMEKMGVHDITQNTKALPRIPGIRASSTTSEQAG